MTSPQAHNCLVLEMKENEIEEGPEEGLESYFSKE